MFLFVSLLGCPAVNDPPSGNVEEVITTVELDIDGTTYTWSDPEDDGDPVIDPVTLTADSSVPISVKFFNRLSSPEEEITGEVMDEATEHQVFIESDVGDWMSTDTDADGLPLGLDGMLDVGAAGQGTLRLVLRHLPEVNDEPVKVDGLQQTFEDQGSTALPGDSDVDVTFDVTVQ